MPIFLLLKYNYYQKYLKENFFPQKKFYIYIYNLKNYTTFTILENITIC